MLQTDRTISLPCGMNNIKSVTADYCNFYFLDCSGCKLFKWSPNEQIIETITLEREYLCICYDPKGNCYWAIPECEAHKIYQLDECFCEVCNITIKGACGQRPISISCDCCSKGLWICYPCQMAYVEMCSNRVTWHENEDSQKINIDLLMQCRCRIIGLYEGNRHIVEVISQCDGEFIEICVPKAYRIVGMTSCLCNNCCENCRFCVLLVKVCSHELVMVEYSIDFLEGELEPCCCPCPPCPPPYPPCPQPCPPCPPPYPPCPPPYPPCPPPYPPCPPPYPPCPPPCPCPPEPNCGVIYEIMHSIALEEAGISHILNAEGEKIQKAVAISDNIEQLVCINESVKRTLTQVTLLEGMLYSKLEALVNCNDCCCHNANIPCPTPICNDCNETQQQNFCE